MSNPPPWSIRLFVSEQGNCPVFTFIQHQGDAALRARIVRKLERLGKFRHQDLRRPAGVDTLDGPIKEYKVDKQIRVLFAYLLEEGVMVMLEADRKKNGHVDPKVVARAKENWDEWLDRRKSVSVERVKEAMR